MGSYFGKGSKEEHRSKQVGKGPQNQLAKQAPFPNCPKYVLKRTSSMFFDADQDLAHEFYEEVAVQLSDGRIRLKMRRIKHNLKPQGIIDLPHPRFHVDYPVVIAYVGPS